MALGIINIYEITLGNNMADRPEITSFNQFIQLNWEMFIPYELWLTDELIDYLVVKRDLEKAYTSIVVDLDRDEPIYGFRDDKIYLRFNGRFYIPVEDKNVQKLNMTSEQWIEIFETWFNEQGLEVVIDETATDLVKFTAIIPVLDMPEEAPAPEGGTDAVEDSVEEEDDVDTEEVTDEGESAEIPEEEPKEESEESEGPKEEGPDESDDMELQEFEKALGL